MSIKGTIKRLENALAKSNGPQVATFVIPYCRDSEQTGKIKRQLVQESGLADRTDLIKIFVISYATKITGEAIC